MDAHDSLWLLLAFPLLGAAVSGALHLATLRARRSGREGPSALAAWVACASVAAAFLLACGAFLTLRGLPADSRVLASTPWSWITVGSFSVDCAVRLDPLSGVMALVVTGVGFLIHVYSVGYMKGDPGFARYFAYLNLFIFAMMLLVTSSSLLGLFVGWEGVGLCSYLLIGFWYEKGWPAVAGQKAFIVNRVGDACFLVGSFLLVELFGTLDLQAIAAGAPALALAGDQGARLALAGVLLFGGCCGKSAQIPLFTWLPDAMAGPTPVSALIHAATMVTAGVYLVVRLNPLFAASPWLLWSIGLVGALTAFVGATSALRQTDIKKVLAYSTVSQLGYMFLALGTGAFAAAIFHLVTHAFFKGLLFLGSGSVIHGMHEEQDMRRMGGLRRHMPRTHVTFLAGAAALSGLPLFAGFFSKDEILAGAFARGGAFLPLWALGLVTAALTAWYTWRMVALTFWGDERFDSSELHPHESPAVMTWPLVVLALLSVAGGALNLPHVLPGHGLLAEWLAPVTEPGQALLFSHAGEHVAPGLEWLLLALSAAIALWFAHRGFHAYRPGPALDDSLAARYPALTSFLGDAWRFDAAYDARVVRPLLRSAEVVSEKIDQAGIDAAVNAAARAAEATGLSLRPLADGHLRSYALWISAGAALLAIVWMWT